MTKTTRILLLATAFWGFCSHADAQTTPLTRTYVSGLGLDTNPCTMASPCKTFQAAISKTVAGGEIYVLNSANYGSTTINKALTITGEGAVAGILATSGTGITIEAGANDVVNLRGLDIDGGNTGSVGIQFKSGLSLNIYKVIVRGFAGVGVDFSPTAASNLYVSETSFANNKGVGIMVVSSGSSSAVKGALHRVTASANGVGIAAIGINASVTVSDAVASNNTFGIGVNAATLMVRNSTISNNTVGIAAEQGSVVRVGQSTVTANGTGLQTAIGGQVQSYVTNNVGGNTVDGTPSATLTLQ